MSHLPNSATVKKNLTPYYASVWKTNFKGVWWTGKRKDRTEYCTSKYDMFMYFPYDDDHGKMATGFYKVALLKGKLCVWCAWIKS